MASKKTETVQDAIVEPATQTELLHALLDSLGADLEQVASVEINVQSGRVRILSKDRSLRSYKVVA